MLLKVGPKGQITIPKALREQFNIKPGDKLAVSTSDEGIVLQPVTETIYDMVGSLPKPTIDVADWELIRETAKEYIAKRVLKPDAE